MAGTRDGPGVPTPTNRVHFACFACRTAFKQRGSSGWDRGVPERPFPCPNCHAPMARLGRYFKAPSRRAARQWLQVELLYRHGERFETSWPPLTSRYRTLADVVAHLARSSGGEAAVRAELARIRAARPGTE